MTATLLGLAYDGRAGEFTLDGSGSITDIYKVQTSDPEDDQIVVASANGLPQIGSAHPSAPGLRAGKILPRNDSTSRTFWLVTVVYAPITNEGLPEPQSLNPNQDVPSVKWTTKNRKKIAEKAKKPEEDNERTGVLVFLGDAIVNSAGDRFDPPPLIDDSTLNLSIKMNIPDVQSLSSWLLTYKDAVNSSEFTIDGISIPSRVAKLMQISITPQRERNGYRFRTLEVVLGFDPDTWDLEILDRGFRELTPDGAGRVNIKNDDGTLISQPALLNGAGYAIPSPKHSSAVYRNFRVYKEKDYSLLPFVGLI